MHESDSAVELKVAGQKLRAQIPPDRQMAYAIELLAGVRPGEASALRWRHYDPTMRPLGKLLVAKSYSTRVGEKTTKTDAVKHVPVHPG